MIDKTKELLLKKLIEENQEQETLKKTFGDVYTKFGHKSRTTNYLFQDIVKKATKRNISNKELNDARQWFRNRALEMKKVSINKLFDSAGNFEKLSNLSNSSIGKMYMYIYDPKYKDDIQKLPYYDKFPLIFPIEYYKDGSMLGINLHYLPPVIRAKLMNALYETLNNEKMDYTTRLQISYKILKSSSRFSAFKPCVKKYLFSHVKSQFIVVKPEYWDYVLMLPLSRFERASNEKVWADSMNKI